MTTSHYCQQKVIGTGCFIDGNEVCGHIMCIKCVLDWDGLAETYRGICRECKDSKESKEKDKEVEKGKTGKNEDEIKEKEKKDKEIEIGKTGKNEDEINEKEKPERIIKKGNYHQMVQKEKVAIQRRRHQQHKR